ncbi:oxidoreductase-like protein [Diplogelasinospora grovesii]|uniref:Oxidoreductase-like protein n=1 Tax=Diplogelasinospora grovesii TaxID=303347 RepID=A0AAN6S141_9PEZI|nr:oxidoreductase-like protein [Diplogelasinospora grovesii]
MRRSIFSARPSSLSAAFRAGGQQIIPRRAFATPPIKDTKVPVPNEPSQEQAHPIGSYYESILNMPQPIPEEKPEVPPTTSAKNPESSPSAESSAPAKRGRKPKETKESKSVASPASDPSSLPSSSAPSSQEPASRTTESNDAQARARVVFGSPLAGPAKRAEQLARTQSQSRLIAGVLVPPKPEEPDNCCMSGCVDCVWDRYRDEMEMWALANAKAKRRLKAQQAGVCATSDAKTAPAQRPVEVGSTSTSMDDDGGGSIGNWTEEETTEFWDEELYKNLPIGIREFIKQEKRLKEKHKREGTVGG